MSPLIRPRRIGRAAGPVRAGALAVAGACLAAGMFVVLHHPLPHTRVSNMAAARMAGPLAAPQAAPAAPAASRAAAEPPPAAPPASAAPSPAGPAGPAPSAAAGTRKGVAAWNFPGARRSLRLSGASWFYTWAAGPNGISAPDGVRFVPMIWGAGSVTSTSLAEARRHGHILLGFNEPDMASQSNLSPSAALNLWPKLQATGMQLGSPAVAFGADRPGGWLDRFMKGAHRRGYRVNFITLHWYGGDFRAAAAAGELKSYLQAVWRRYHKPIWLTEYALTDFGASPARYPSWSQQAAFVTASTAMLERLPYLRRYAWFALPSNSTDGTVGLYRSGAHPTAAGRAFAVAGHRAG
jgi:hypothetical protein